MPGSQGLATVECDPDPIEPGFTVDSSDETSGLPGPLSGHLRAAIRAKAIMALGWARQRRDHHKLQMIHSNALPSSSV